MVPYEQYFIIFFHRYLSRGSGRGSSFFLGEEIYIFEDWCRASLCVENYIFTKMCSLAPVEAKANWSPLAKQVAKGDPFSQAKSTTIDHNLDHTCSQPCYRMLWLPTAVVPPSVLPLLHYRSYARLRSLSFTSPLVSCIDIKSKLSCRSKLWTN